MSGPCDVPCKTYHVMSVVDEKLAQQIENFMFRLSVHKAGYQVLTDWHPVVPEGWGEFPSLPVQRSTVYRGNADTWAYSHHQTIAKLGENYVVSWSNGFLHEDYVGQEVHYAYSPDAVTWSEPGVVVSTPVESEIVRNNAGLYAADGKLYCYVGAAHNFGRDVASPGMSTLDGPPMRLEAYVTEDLTEWTKVGDICEGIYLFEGPRPTRGGRLMCKGTNMRDNHGMVLIWDDASDPGAVPRVVHLPPSQEGVVPGQSTWYQTDDGRIWLYHRESSLLRHLGLCWSDDEGDTWSEIYYTDFPNTFSRAFVGRLSDGRYYIAGNNYDIFLDRMHLLVALSDDGRKFTRQYTLVEGETTRRVNGRHKEDGYHYPNCIVDGDHLVLTYSVNKEDIEVATVDMSQAE